MQKAASPKDQKQGKDAPSYHFYSVLYWNVIPQEKEIKGKGIWEGEIKLHFFEGDMIINVENPRVDPP